MSELKPIKLFAVGDLMLGDSPVCHGFGVCSAISKRGPRFPFQHVESHLKGADVLFGNLEVVVSRFDFDHDDFAHVQFRGQPESLEGLSGCGFDVVSVCSNHSMQHGSEAFEEMIDSLNDKRTEPIGAENPARGLKNFSLIEQSGWRIGFLGYNFRPQQYFDAPPQWKTPSREMIVEEIKAVRENLDCLVLSLHWGDEFVDYPSPEQVSMAHEFVENGADIIIGHHPHIIQGIESYKGGVIAYSLGNFVFDMWQDYLRRTYILECELAEPGKVSCSITPVIINRNYQPELAGGAEAEAIRNHVERISELISDDESTMEAYLDQVEKRTAKFRKEVRSFYLRNLHRYSIRRFAENFFGALKKRF